MNLAKTFKHLILSAALCMAIMACLHASAADNVQLTPDQIAKVHDALDTGLSLIPAKYEGTVTTIIAILGALATVGRLVRGWQLGGLFGALGGLFHGSNKPIEPTKTPSAPSAPSDVLKTPRQAGAAILLALLLPVVAMGQIVGPQPVPPTSDSPVVASVTNNPTAWTVYAQEIYNFVQASGITAATNWSAMPYFTYAPSAPSGNQVGGGLLCCYDMSQYAGLGIGVDYLGQFSLVSANVSLKLPMHPLKGFTSLPESLADISVVPFTLAGIGSPLGGTSGTGASTIMDTGAYFEFGHWGKGRFIAGASYGQWANAGDYSGKRYHIFAGWGIGF